MDSLQIIYSFLLPNIVLNLTLLVYNLYLFINNKTPQSALINKGLFYTSFLFNHFFFFFWILSIKNINFDAVPTNFFLLICLLQWFALIKRSYKTNSNRLVDLILCFVTSFLLVISSYLIFILSQQFTISNLTMMGVFFAGLNLFITSGFLYFFILCLSAYLCFREIKFKKKFFFNKRLPSLSRHVLEIDKLLLFLTFVFFSYSFLSLLLYWYFSNYSYLFANYQPLDTIFYFLIVVLLGGSFIIKKLKGLLPNHYLALASVILFLFFLTKMY